MKHDDIHWAALRATAKVALSLTVFGCGGSVSIVGNKGEGSSQGGASTNASSQTGASQGGASTVQVASAGGQMQGQGGAGGASLMCSASDPSQPVTLDPSTFACCVDFLGQQSDAAWTMPPAELTACCHEVVGQIDLDPTLLASVDEAFVSPTWPPNESPSCCDVLGNPCTQPCGCTVWGPPMPAALRGSLWSLDMLEVA